VKRAGFIQQCERLTELPRRRWLAAPFEEVVPRKWNLNVAMGSIDGDGQAGSTEDLRSLILWLSNVMPESTLFGLGERQVQYFQ
jgi:hypothetical protein